MPPVVYGFPNHIKMPSNVDFYIMSNEDVGFTVTLVTGTNESYQYAMPYPASFDIETESLIVYALEFWNQIEHEYNTVGGNFISMSAFLSMLRKTLEATSRGQATDTTDEFLKAQFARNIAFGQSGPPISTVNITGLPSNDKFDTVSDAMYFPPVPLDLVTPLYVTLVNTSKTRTLATNAAADLSNASVDLFMSGAWFTTRRLTQPERDAKAMQIAWQRLDS